MSDGSDHDQSDDARRFEQEAERPSAGLVREFIDFLRHSKKWWLLPIVVTLLLLGALVLLTSSPLSPFIYTVF